MTRKNVSKKTYHWKGVTADGEYKTGKIAAISPDEANKVLHTDGISPFYIKEKYFSTMLRNEKQVSKKHIASFLQQFSYLFNAGIPIFTALEMLKNNYKNQAIRNLTEEIKRRIEKGNSLSSILTQYPNYFSDLFCNLIMIGEHSGTLDTILIYIANYIENAASQKRKLTKILLYPCIVFVFTFVVVIIFLVFIIPQFQEMFSNFGATLPIYTRLIISISEHIKKYGALFSFILLALAILSICAYKRTTWLKCYCDKIALQIPYFGGLIKKSIIARIMRTLSITFKAGIPIYDALAFAAKIANNDVYKKGLETIRKDILNGKMLCNSIEKTSIFPEQVTQLIAVGEESGKLDEMFAQLAKYYENEVSRVTENLQTLLEPTIIIILGIIVGSLIVGMYLPIFQLGKIM